ncbi:RHS repeat-associated core domain-containing protein, partial [Pseudomonas syringae group genomosp. 7]|uniref:RHS repeat-associated core domain-containing protein n=1 Tax=Pseudomonas syringae group genomosp. 7 TaxID=251699 RepID=UPI00376FFC3B
PMSTTTSLHSNAFNFMSFLSSGVDPRTGLYTASISLPELKANDLAGPFVPITLAFSPLNTRDSGYGFGWNLQLSQYDPVTRMLSLSSGESFKVTHTSVGGDRLLMKEQKLDSFHVHDTGGDTFRIVHKSGLVERLRVGGSADNRLALPYEISSPDGRAVYLAYDYFNGQQILASVSDSQRTLLRLTRENRRVEITLNPDLFPTRFSMELAEDDFRVAKVVLPTKDAACWRFRYERLNGLLCIIDAWTPSGAHETARYDDAGHLFPGTLARPALRRVTEHVSDPGQGQPPIRTRYGYRAHNTVNTHNFLGNNAAGLIWEDNGEDNLYRIRGDYQYGTTESLIIGNQVVRTVERSFNRFHLLTEETTTQGDNVKKTRTVYHALEQTDFDQQPPYFQLLKTVTTGWSLRSNASQVRYETVSSDYDNFGNLTRQVQPSGVVETSTWYPAEGETQGEFQCPPDPQDFVRQVRTRTVTPAPSTYGEAAPVLRTRFVYDTMAPVSGASQPWLVLTRETLLRVQGDSETTLHTTGHLYIQQPEDALSHGRPLLDTFTLNGISTLTSFAYSKSLSRAVKKGKQAETVLKTTQTLSSTLDSHTRTINLEHSLLNGEPLLTLDDAKVEIRYTYDALERITSETVAPDTSYEATRHYAYGLVAADGQMAHQEVTDVKGVTTRSELDGLGRVFRETRQNTEGDGLMRDTYAATYDARGQLQTETRYDWLDEKQKTLTLTSTFGYDDWGQQVSETGPDGVVAFQQTYQQLGTSGPEQHEWRQTSLAATEQYGLTVTRLNPFEKPESVERFTQQGTTVSKQIYRYDGLGRTVEEVDALNHVTRYGYDAFDRMIKTTLPGGASVTCEYAVHSIEDLPTAISVDGYILGRQSFDGLERRYKSVTGGREQMFTFETGQTQPKTVRTASEQTIEYMYLPSLSDQPLQREILGSGASATYTYDSKDARLSSCEEQGQGLTRDYSTIGELKRETRTVGAQTWTMHYRYSLMGLLMEYTDVLGQGQSYTYDGAGRLTETQLGDITSTFSYDSLGQTCDIETLEGPNKVAVKLIYDEFGREVQRDFDLGGVQQVMTQVYDANDRIKQRTLVEGGTLLRDEGYTYDARGRLTLYTCSGSQLPVDPYGKSIQRQLFRFDNFDNLSEVQTVFPGGTNVATYHYADRQIDPTQLLGVTNTHDEYPELVLSYDADGNLIQDEQGRTLRYDALGRLLEVSVPSIPGKHSDHEYRHDALDVLAARENSQGVEQRFYQDGKPVNQISGTQQRTFMRGGDGLLADQQSGAGAATRLLATTLSNTVLSEVVCGAKHDSAYTAYGYRSSDEPPGGTGFNGELTESDTGWQLLGNGYRAYNPVLMRFHSPDSLSPFGEGGLNAYVYVGGDPVNGVDPSGHVTAQQLIIRRYGARPQSLSASPGRVVGSSKQSAAVTTRSPNVIKPSENFNFPEGNATFFNGKWEMYSSNKRFPGRRDAEIHLGASSNLQSNSENLGSYAPPLASGRRRGAFVLERGGGNVHTSLFPQLPDGRRGAFVMTSANTATAARSAQSFSGSEPGSDNGIRASINNNKVENSLKGLSSVYGGHTNIQIASFTIRFYS